MQTLSAQCRRQDAMKIRSSNSTLPNAWRGQAPAAVAPGRKRHFGIDDVVPPELRPEVICRAEVAQGPRVIEYSDHVRLSFGTVLMLIFIMMKLLSKTASWSHSGLCCQTEVAISSAPSVASLWGVSVLLCAAATLSLSRAEPGCAETVKPATYIVTTACLVCVTSNMLLYSSRQPAAPGCLVAVAQGRALLSIGH